MDQGKEIEENTHSHCLSCYLTNCNNNQICPIISCPLHCGHMFHECKYDDHRLLCNQMKMACLNSHYGCPFIVLRKNLSAHLEMCPASVIFCTMQWNRWPRYSNETQSVEPLYHHNFEARFTQLDAALAIRDQKVFYEMMKSLSKEKIKVLRDGLTKRYPPVLVSYVHHTRERCESSPLLMLNISSELLQHNRISVSTETSFSSEDTEAPWEMSKNPPGLERCICSKLFNMRSTTTTRIKRVDDTDVEECMVKDVTSDVKTSESIMNNDNYDLSKRNDDNDRDSLNNNNNSINNDNNKEIIKTSEEVNSLLLLKHLLCIDMNIQMISQYELKPKSMYTFICAELMKRNEYASHFLNFHNDIQGGSDNWIEHRCPLACYGCTYSMRRLNPSHASLVFDRDSNNFCVRPKNYEIDKSKETTPELYVPKNSLGHLVILNGSRLMKNEPNNLLALHKIHFYDLPGIVMGQILSYLDSISLKKLSLVSRHLRDVCYGYVKERGMVVEAWQKHHFSDFSTWQVTGYKWMYSNSFAHVKRWTFDSDENISNHLEHCPFNLKVDHQKELSRYYDNASFPKTLI